MPEITGGCLCGAVRYRTQAEPGVCGHCHCEDCRRSSGTAHCTHVLFPDDRLEVTGALRFFDKPADSGNVVSRGFCPSCGSPILSRNAGWPNAVFVRASSLDDMEAAKPAVAVFASRAPSWDQPDPSQPSFPEMPPAPPREATA